jgi:2',3'-cyclic-nucleotide 2'-phosphodiesterase (5'-nucleotidase family)
MSGYKPLLTAILSAALVLPFSSHAAKKTITFMELNDLHAHLVPHTDVVSDGNGGTKVETRGGLTRIATLVKQIRAENPNSVLMNIGDTYHTGLKLNSYNH